MTKRTGSWFTDDAPGFADGLSPRSPIRSTPALHAAVADVTLPAQPRPQCKATSNTADKKTVRLDSGWVGQSLTACQIHRPRMCPGARTHPIGANAHRIGVIHKACAHLFN